MRLSVVIAGAAMLLAGVALIIISGNAINAINSCPAFFSTYTCAPFLGADSRQASLANAYSMLEIGIMITVASAIVILLGRIAKTT